MAKEQVVLAYSGGLDTSVILGWLMDEGYDVHAVYVDLGQPCEDREAILKKGIATSYDTAYHAVRKWLSVTNNCNQV